MAKFSFGPSVMPELVKALCAMIDSGKSSGYMELYDKAGNGGVMLAKLKFAYPCASAFGEDYVTFKEFSPEVDAPGRGRVGWAVTFNSTGTRVFECDAGEESDAAKPFVVLDDAFIRKGDLVRVKSFTLKLRQPQQPQ